MRSGRRSPSPHHPRSRQGQTRPRRHVLTPGPQKLGQLRDGRLEVRGRVVRDVVHRLARRRQRPGGGAQAVGRDAGGVFVSCLGEMGRDGPTVQRITCVCVCLYLPTIHPNRTPTISAAIARCSPEVFDEVAEVPPVLPPVVRLRRPVGKQASVCVGSERVCTCTGRPNRPRCLPIPPCKQAQTSTHRSHRLWFSAVMPSDAIFGGVGPWPADGVCSCM